MTDRICLCADGELCALCGGLDDPDVIAVADEVLARLLGGN